jgi:hypothetical protein
MPGSPQQDGLRGFERKENGSNHLCVLYPLAEKSSLKRALPEDVILGKSDAQLPSQALDRDCPSVQPLCLLYSSGPPLDCLSVNV